jgi:hypothetical protein
MPFDNNPTTRDIANRQNGRPKTSEKTGPQVLVHRFSLGQPKLFWNYSFDWFQKVRTMREDPTISLLRDLVLGPIISSEWSIGHTDKAPKGAVDLVSRNMLSMRRYLVEHTLTGYMDFGWQAFEPVWAIDDDGHAIIDKVKPLLQDITEILVDHKTGEFIGTIQNMMFGQQQLELITIDKWPITGVGYLKAKDVILCNINVEGTYWYGRPIMKNEVIPYEGWVAVNNAADIYDRKIAGSHWIIYFPVGVTAYFQGRTDVPNEEVAAALMQSLDRSGAISVPTKVSQYIDEFNNSKEQLAWKIELLSDMTSQQSNFVDRLKYYDALKARALGFPERSIQEGQFGTKAEAEVHSDAAVAIAEYRHAKLTEQISTQTVNNILRYNYGKKAIGSVFLKPAPIADDIKHFLRQIFQALVQSSPEVALDKINAREVKERLGLPLNMKEDSDSEFDFSLKTSDVSTKSLSPNGTNPTEGDDTSDPLRV